MALGKQAAEIGFAGAIIVGFLSQGEGD